eukprot:scaffold184_cov316-Pinguiococcus_pyrenoidosus.AAC.14
MYFHYGTEVLDNRCESLQSRFHWMSFMIATNGDAPGDPDFCRMESLLHDAVFRGNNKFRFFFDILFVRRSAAERLARSTKLQKRGKRAFFVVCGKPPTFPSYGAGTHSRQTSLARGSGSSGDYTTSMHQFSRSYDRYRSLSISSYDRSSEDFRPLGGAQVPGWSLLFVYASVRLLESFHIFVIEPIKTSKAELSTRRSRIGTA